MELSSSFKSSFNSIMQLESDLQTSCSGRSDTECLGSPTFAQYSLVRELNGGATSRVYEAAERSGGAHVALKVLNSKPCGGYVLPSSIIQQEINCAKRLEHKHIAKLLDVVAHEGRLALAFELVRGPDLLDYIKGCHNRVPEQLGLHYFRQLLSAVTHMHQQGIAHRDLKPENCMIDPQTHCLKVIDFGLAAPLEAHMPPGCGTLNTIAPECIVQEGVAPAQNPVAVDVWGLGVTLYITLVGKFPFQDTRRPHSDQQQVYNTLKGRLNPLPDRISGGTRQLIMSMLQTDPTLRPSLQQILAHPCLAEADLHEAFLYESQVFGGSSGMGPCSPSCESAASDQTHMPCSTSCDTPVDDGSQSVSMRPERGLNYMLERYLTTNTADKKRPPICQTEVKNSIMASSGVLQRRSSALQPEIVRAALRSSPAPVQSPIPTQTTSPQVVSVFSEASQSQGFFMWEDEEYQGLPFDESPIQERSSVKLFTMSQEDITSRRSNDISKAEESNRLRELPTVPEGDEYECAEELTTSVHMSSSSSDRSTFAYGYPANESESGCATTLRHAYSQDLERVPPLGPRHHRATMSEYPAQMAGCTVNLSKPASMSSKWQPVCK